MRSPDQLATRMWILVILLVVGCFLVATTVDADSLSARAHLSRHVLSTDTPGRYEVDLGTNITNISGVDYEFVFVGNDPLDPGECLSFTGGFPEVAVFCNFLGPVSLTSQTFTFPCSEAPTVCDAWLDGFERGKIIVSAGDGGPASVRIETLRITVHGEREPLNADNQSEP